MSIPSAVFIGIDVGTSACKVVAVDGGGKPSELLPEDTPCRRPSTDGLSKFQRIGGTLRARRSERSRRFWVRGVAMSRASA